MTEKKLKLYTNLIFYLGFIPLITLLVPTERWGQNRPVLLISIIVYLMVAFQIISRWNIPRLVIRHHYLKASIYMAAALVTTFAFAKLTNLLNVYEPGGMGSIIGATRIESTVWFLFFVIIGYSFFNNMVMESARLRQSREEIESQRDKAELAMYKSQINPHFLFNTLNTLYGLILTDSDKREEAFEKFINMCKYTYSNANRDYISIQEEVDYLQEYVDLQKLRLGGKTTVTSIISIDNPQARIAPMLLINYVENAFKYGVSSTEESEINLKLTVMKGVLRFAVHNSHVNPNVKTSSRNGLRNTRHRLDLLYPDKYTLRHRLAADGYHVRLTIKLSAPLP